jgi:glycosyltransferase involved in cell wall biosynthesis
VRILLIGGGVHPIPPTGYGAIERILTDLQAALRAAGHEAEIVNRVRHERMRDEYPFARELPGLLARERYDALHAHTPVVANRLAGRGLAFAYTSHSRHWFYRDRWSHRWGYFLERRGVRRSTETIALTPHLAATMRARVRPPLPPISVIPFGVDASRFGPHWETRTGRRAIGVGVVLPFKRWELAARALRGSGIGLTIIGPTPSAEYAARVRAAGDEVALTGEISEAELRARLAESDLLLHPSAVEVLSATVLEAMAAGLPILGGPALDGVVESGRTGWIVDDTDPAAFVAGLGAHARSLALDGSTRRAMGEAARGTAVQHYAWPAIAQAHLAVYARVQAAARSRSAGG